MDVDLQQRPRRAAALAASSLLSSLRSSQPYRVSTATAPPPVRADPPPQPDVNVHKEEAPKNVPIAQPSPRPFVVVHSPTQLPAPTAAYPPPSILSAVAVGLLAVLVAIPITLTLLTVFIPLPEDFWGWHSGSSSSGDPSIVGSSKSSSSSHSNVEIFPAEIRIAGRLVSVASTCYESFPASSAESPLSLVHLCLAASFNRLIESFSSPSIISQWSIPPTDTWFTGFPEVLTGKSNIPSPRLLLPRLESIRSLPNDEFQWFATGSVEIMTMEAALCRAGFLLDHRSGFPPEGCNSTDPSSHFIHIRSGTFLEYGCGRGRYSLSILHRYHFTRMFFTDITRRFLEELAGRIPASTSDKQVFLLCIGWDITAIGRDQFDFIFAPGQVLPWMSPLLLRESIHQLCSLLRPGTGVMAMHVLLSPVLDASGTTGGGASPHNISFGDATLLSRSLNRETPLALFPVSETWLRTIIAESPCTVEGVFPDTELTLWPSPPADPSAPPTPPPDLSQSPVEDQGSSSIGQPAFVILARLNN